jgi:hypothetical protein
LFLPSRASQALYLTARYSQDYSQFPFQTFSSLLLLRRGGSLKRLDIQLCHTTSFFKSTITQTRHISKSTSASYTIGIPSTGINPSIAPSSFKREDAG